MKSNYSFVWTYRTYGQLTMDVILTSAFGVKADTQNSLGDEYTKHADIFLKRNPVAGLAGTLVSMLNLVSRFGICVPLSPPLLSLFALLSSFRVQPATSQPFIPPRLCHLPLISLLHYPPFHIYSATRKFTCWYVALFLLFVVIFPFLVPLLPLITRLGFEGNKPIAAATFLAHTAQKMIDLRRRSGPSQVRQSRARKQWAMNLLPVLQTELQRTIKT